MLTRLNEQQRTAVTATEGPVLVIAGAGSGKTRVLTTRIAHLLQDHRVHPDQILAFTFTNKAAREMRERVAQLVPAKVRGCWIGTFHATGVRILRQQAARLGLPNTFSIYDATDSRTLLTTILKEQHADPKMFSPKGVAAEISRFKNGFVDPEKALAQALTPRDEKVAKAFGEYQKRLRANGALDFDDLIALPVELFESHRDVQQSYSRRFRYVLVDEFQDTNPLQLVMIRALCSVHGNLFAVGDDDQAIYSWRGATVDNMLHFDEYFPGATVLRLEQNYRSTSVILQAANAVIAHNRRRRGKTLWSEHPGGDKVELWWADDGDDEGSIVRDRIQSLVREGAARKDVAILYRTNAQSRALEDALRREGIPYQIVGGTRFFERREVRDLLAYLKVVANPADTVSFLRILNVPRRGIGKTSVDRLAIAAAQRGVTPLSLCQDAAQLASCDLGPSSKRLLEFGKLITQLTRLAESKDAAVVFKQVLAATGYEDWLEKDDPATAEERTANVMELGNAVHSFVSESDVKTLDAFLESVSLLSDVDSMQDETDVVTLMTVHTAKGLEYGYVFVAGCEEGLLPHASSLEDDDAVEEERRLFYVAITRAQRRVFLSSAATRQRFGGYEPMLPSRFLRELPEELLDEHAVTVPQPHDVIRRPTFGLQPTPRSRPRRRPGHDPDAPAARDAFSVETFRRSRARQAAEGAQRPTEGAHGFTEHELNQEEVHFAPGVRVRHDLLGEGVIEKVEGMGDLTRLTIEFEAGRKKVLARYAHLVVLDDLG
jgi:DNA helicase-2/ATP-dependent DNA helicase PcrA